MTKEQEKYKSDLIKWIHVAKKNVFPDDSYRRDFLKSRFNCTSTKDMSIDQLKLLLDFCNNKVSDIPLEDSITEAQKKKIRDLWKIKSREKTESSLKSFILRQTQRPSIDFLTKREVSKVIIAINKLS